MRHRAALLTWLLVGLVAALAAAAALDAFRGGTGRAPAEAAESAGTGGTSEAGETGEASAGPPRPQPLAAGRLAGTLWVETPGDCRLRAVRLADLGVGDPGPSTGCGLWAAPNGRLAVVPRGRAPLSGVRPLWLVRLGEPPSLVAALGKTRGAASWSADSRRVAWCDRLGTVVLEVATRQRERVRGCRPKLAPGGGVLTRPDRPLAAELWRDGRVLLAEADLRGAFGGARGGLVDVLGFDAGPGGLVALTAVHFARGRKPRIALGLWRGGTHVATLELPDFGEPRGPYKALGRVAEVVEFSPDGSELLVASREAGVGLRVFDVRTRVQVMRRDTDQAADWSPDGIWLALSGGDELLFHGPSRGAPELVFSLAAGELAWRP